MSDDRKACCRVEENLSLPEVVREDEGGLETFRRCKVCGCRHFEVEIKPGRFDVRGRNL